MALHVRPLKLYTPEANKRRNKLGRPYKSELKELSSTYDWALSLDVEPLRQQLLALRTSSLVCIGSGGAQSTAVLMADLHQGEFGQISKAETPLMAAQNVQSLGSSVVALVSARGRNPDILGIARTVVDAEPEAIIVLCATMNSPLEQAVRQFSRTFSFEFRLPTGKDGFLATNSLLALSLVVLRSYGQQVPKSWPLVEAAALGAGAPGKISSGHSSFLKMRHLIILHGAYSRSAAFDLESKLVEAGLVSVMVSDYRNFAHGRHHWLAKNPETAVVALASKEEVPLAKRTLKLLPAETPSVLIGSDLTGYESWAELQANVFDLVSKYGDKRKIDPGRPGVPDFGRRIYHLKAFPLVGQDIDAGVERKARADRRHDHAYMHELRKSVIELRRKFCRAKFNGLVLDYDGTICDHANRFEALPEITSALLRRIPEGGFLLGIATGRGKSVRQALRAAIPEKLWHRILIGYYNGAVIAALDDSTEPNLDRPIATALVNAAEALQPLSKTYNLQVTVRPEQITVEGSPGIDVQDLWTRVAQCVDEQRIAGVRVVASTRSIDIVTTKTSKLNLVRALEAQQTKPTILCIGDRPCWPGNDAELLQQNYSLSVDAVDGNPKNAWNLAPAGVLGAAALRYYLGQMTMMSDHFVIRLDGNERSTS